MSPTSHTSQISWAGHRTLHNEEYPLHSQKDIQLQNHQAEDGVEFFNSVRSGNLKEGKTFYLMNLIGFHSLFSHVAHC